MNKFKGIQTLFKNKFLNFYHMDALTDSGRTFDYYFVSRNSKDKLKAVTKEHKPEGIVIYPVLESDPEKIVLIRQYRYPVGDYIYELPAGLIDNGEDADTAAVREMKEETGFDFIPYKGGKDCYRKPLFMGAGYTDEASAAVFGYAFGDVRNQKTEDTESIEVIIADKKKAEYILENEKVSLRCGYLLMNFINSDKNNPFGFLD